MKTLNYEGNVLEYKSSHRALIDYELLNGKDKVETYTDSMKMMFCIVRAQARGAGMVFDLDFDGFIDWLDKHPEALDGIALSEEEKSALKTGSEGGKKN